MLWRPELTQKYRGAATRMLALVLERLSAATMVALADVPRVSRDSADDIFIATAVASGARYVISEDRDLLDIVTYGEIQIINAETFLDILDAR